MKVPLLLLLAVGLAHADADQDKAVARIEYRQELKKKFTEAGKAVTEKLEDFALQPIRSWDPELVADLAKTPKADLLDPLRYYLTDEDWEVKAFTCLVIGEAGAVELIPELEKAYEDARYPIVRRKAVEAAATFAKRLGTKEASGLLTWGLEDGEPGVRMIAVAGFEWLKDLDSLRKAVPDKDHDTRYRALAALARLEDGQAQAALFNGFQSYVATKDLLRRPSLETHDVGERYSQFLNALALGYWGGADAVKLLDTALQRDGDFRNKLFLSIGAAASLGKARPLDAKAVALRDQAIKDAIGGKDAAVRAMGAFAAGFTLDPQFVRPLERLLKDAQSDVRHNAVEALGRIPGDAAVDALASVVKTESDVPVRLAAVRALSRHEVPAAIDALSRALKDKRYMVRAAAARMLGRRGAAAAPAVKALVSTARDRDYGVRESAVVALSRIGALDGLEAIFDALKDRDQGVRVHALRGLTRFADRAAVAADASSMERVVKLLLAADEDTERLAARECLLTVRSPASVPSLLRELDSDQYARRNAAFIVLRDLAGGRSLEYTPQATGSERRETVKAWKDWWDNGGPIVPEPPAPKKRASQDMLPGFHRYTRDLRWRGIDLVLAYDSTGSMIPVIRAVKQRLDLLIEESARIVPNLRLSLFTYRDQGEEYVFYGTPLTYATENLKAFVQVAEANRGGDLPEAVTPTVEAAIKRLDWRKDAQKVIVVIGDAPYHPEAAPKLFELVRQFCKKENHGIVHAIFTDPNRLGESINARRKREEGGVTYPFLERFKEMVKVGGGRAITIEDTEMLITEILVLSFGEQWRAELESRLDFE